MKFSKLLIIILMLCVHLVSAQQNEIGLLIGDRFPDFVIPKVINPSNGKKGNDNTSNYRDKLLIIDFWATSCPGCVRSLANINPLETKFNGKVKIIPVTEEKEEHILQFWNVNKYTQSLKNLSVVVDDKLFSRLFKHRFIPHEIWIYKGRIIAITSSEYVDDYNIERVLKGGSINWPIKNDFYYFDRNKPLFNLDDNKKVSKESVSIQYTAISDFRKNNNSPIWLSGGNGILRDSINKTVRIFFVNQPILNSYLQYWSHLVKLSSLVIPYFGFVPNQVVWEVNDRSYYTFEEKRGLYSQDWLMKNGICFESLYLDTGQKDEKVYQSAISDLNRLLGLNVRWEKRKEKILILKHNQFKSIKSYRDGNYSIYEIFTNLNEQPENPYVFNESGEKNLKIPLKISSWKDIESIRTELQRSGFELIEQDRIVDKLIFTDINTKSNY